MAQAASLGEPELLTALRALADPLRLQLLRELRRSEECVTPLAERVGAPRALVSHHLRVLTQAGLIHERRAGKWVCHSLDTDALARLLGGLDSLLDPRDLPDEAACRGNAACGEPTE